MKKIISSLLTFAIATTAIGARADEAALKQQLRDVTNESFVQMARIQAIDNYSQNIGYKLYIDKGASADLMAATASLFVTFMLYDIVSPLDQATARQINIHIEQALQTMPNEDFHSLYREILDQSSFTLQMVEHEIDIKTASHQDVTVAKETLQKIEGLQDLLISGRIDGRGTLLKLFRAEMRGEKNPVLAALSNDNLNEAKQNAIEYVESRGEQRVTKFKTARVTSFAFVGLAVIFLARAMMDSDGPQNPADAWLKEQMKDGKKTPQQLLDLVKVDLIKLNKRQKQIEAEYIKTNQP